VTGVASDLPGFQFWVAVTDQRIERLIDGGASPEAAFDQAIEDLAVNFVFATSTSYPADFGGLAGADAICNQHAGDAGLPGTYVAWLSTTTVDARDRLAGARGFVRPDGLPFADTVDDALTHN